jgi:prolipoprotein diacylglyceryltransferase
MYPVLLSLGKFKLYSFGTFIALGAITAGLVLYSLSRRRKVRTQAHFDLVLYSLLAGLVGARIGYYALYSEQFQNVWQIIYFWQGGLVALPGLIVGFAVFWRTLRLHALPVWTMLDAGMLSLLVGWGIGKFGCHLSACTIGRAADFLTINGMYPVDLLSVLWSLAVAAVLAVIWTTQRLGEGVIFFIGAEALLLGEFLLKTLKADFGQGLSQLETVTYLVLMVLIYVAFWRLHGPQLGAGKLSGKLRSLIGR